MASKSGVTCPNCGRELYKGWADGDVLVCRDNSDPAEGCQLAVDPNNLHGVSALTLPEGAVTGVWDAPAPPEVGPPNEAEPVVVRADPDPSGLPYEVPISAPQAMNQEPVEPVAVGPQNVGLSEKEAAKIADAQAKDGPAILEDTLPVVPEPPA